jgi:hypothetical protein
MKSLKWRAVLSSRDRVHNDAIREHLEVSETEGSIKNLGGGGVQWTAHGRRMGNKRLAKKASRCKQHERRDAERPGTPLQIGMRPCGPTVLCTEKNKNAESSLWRL